MLSILIPVYNFDVRKLVVDLHYCCISENIKFEIICFDDGSEKAFKEINTELKHISNCTYTELPQNIGRSAIRNKLAQNANYLNLLFLDCDSALPDKNFIKNYLPYFDKTNVVYGGREYEKKRPAKEFILRWKYGQERETISVKERKKDPYLHFLTNNFLINKNIFRTLQFNETLKGYGHEDTLFALELKNIKIEIEHIHNPVYHIGLETCDEFLTKTEEGIENLIKLKSYNNVDLDSVKLVAFEKKLAKYKIAFLPVLFYRIFKPLILNNLHSLDPSLKMFDLFKYVAYKDYE